VPTDAPTLKKLTAAVGKLKNGKSDGITAELLKHSIDSSGSALHKLFCRVWVTGKVSADWRMVSSFPCTKEKVISPNVEATDQSPSFQSQASFLLIYYLLESNFYSSARGDRSSLGLHLVGPPPTTVLALHLLSDLHREFSRPLYVAYVDLKSAFDSVDREAL